MLYSSLFGLGRFRVRWGPLGPTSPNHSCFWCLCGFVVDCFLLGGGGGVFGFFLFVENIFGVVLFLFIRIVLFYFCLLLFVCWSALVLIVSCCFVCMFLFCYLCLLECFRCCYCFV